jgi:lysophospholipase L1-like esterase
MRPENWPSAGRLTIEKAWMKTILLVGSSIFEQWRNLDGFGGGIAVRNRAVGGTLTSYWRVHLSEVVRAETPDAVLFYCGSNDLNENVPPEETIANTFFCRQVVRQLQPEAKFSYFSIIKAPQKKGKWALVERLNAAIQAGLPVGDLYVETNRVFWKARRPVARYFVEDGLHLTDEAYAALSANSVPLITRWLETARPAGPHRTE